VTILMYNGDFLVISRGVIFLYQMPCLHSLYHMFMVYLQGGHGFVLEMFSFENASQGAWVDRSVGHLTSARVMISGSSD